MWHSKVLVPVNACLWWSLGAAWAPSWHKGHRNRLVKRTGRVCYWFCIGIRGAEVRALVRRWPMVQRVRQMRRLCSWGWASTLPNVDSDRIFSIVPIFEVHYRRIGLSTPIWNPIFGLITSHLVGCWTTFSMSKAAHALCSKRWLRMRIGGRKRLQRIGLQMWEFPYVSTRASGSRPRPRIEHAQAVLGRGSAAPKSG